VVFGVGEFGLWGGGVAGGSGGWGGRGGGHLVRTKPHMLYVLTQMMNYFLTIRDNVANYFVYSNYYSIVTIRYPIRVSIV